MFRLNDAVRSFQSKNQTLPILRCVAKSVVNLSPDTNRGIPQVVASVALPHPQMGPAAGENGARLPAAHRFAHAQQFGEPAILPPDEIARVAEKMRSMKYGRPVDDGDAPGHDGSFSRTRACLN